MTLSPVRVASDITTDIWQPADIWETLKYSAAPLPADMMYVHTLVTLADMYTTVYISIHLPTSRYSAHTHTHTHTDY